MQVLRISHSAVVGAWRRREAEIRLRGVPVRLLSARVWDEGGTMVPLVPECGEEVSGVRTYGRHPILFLYDPWPIWHALGLPHDVLDIHEEPYALATAEVLLLRLLRRRRAPYMLYSAQNIKRQYPVPFRWLERWALRGAAAVSACNVEASAICVSKGLTGVARTIPLGVDLDHFRPAAERNRSGQGLLVGYVGRLETRKGVDVIVDAVAADPLLRLILVGGGPREPDLVRHIHDLGVSDRITVTGPIDQAALAELYRSLDVLVVPSLPTATWREQFCRVAVEAMASGVPVVASRSGAIPEVLGDAGILVEPGNPAELARALDIVRRDHELCDRLRTAGLARATRYTWRQVADDYVQLYRQIGADSGPHSPQADARAQRPPVEVVIVAYGTPELFAQAIAPLASYHRVTVVDNSANADVRALTETVGATYIDPGRNLGFAGAVNLGLARRAPGADVLLVNPDAVILPLDIDRLSRTLHQATDIASVGPRQTDASGREARVTWPFPSPVRAWLDAAGVGSKPCHSGFVIGSVLLLRASALDDVGDFDERFFLYAEEADWAYRAYRRGWRHVVDTQAYAMHHGAGTGGDPCLREALFHSSTERFLRKHHGAVGWQIARVGVAAGALARVILTSGERRAAARRRFRLYWQGPVRAAARAHVA